MKVFVLHIVEGLTAQECRVFDSYAKAKKAFKEKIGIDYQDEWQERYLFGDIISIKDGEKALMLGLAEFEQTNIYECEVE